MVDFQIIDDYVQFCKNNRKTVRSHVLQFLVLHSYNNEYNTGTTPFSLKDHFGCSDKGSQAAPRIDHPAITQSKGRTDSKVSNGEPTQAEKDTFWRVWNSCTDAEDTVHKDVFFLILSKKPGFSIEYANYIFEHMIEMGLIYGTKCKYKYRFSDK